MNAMDRKGKKLQVLLLLRFPSTSVTVGFIIETEFVVEALVFDAAVVVVGDKQVSYPIISGKIELFDVDFDEESSRR